MIKMSNILELHKYTRNKRNYYLVQMTNTESYLPIGEGFTMTYKQAKRQLEQLKYFDELNLIPQLKNYIEALQEIIKE